MDDVIKAKRVAWRGQQFDSQLEADWASTFVSWGLEYAYHPGRVFLGDSVWEPDFQVDAGPWDVLFEVKGAGNDRIEKVHEARRMGFNVIVGRVGWIPAGTDVEVAGAMWEDANEWFLVERPDGSTRFHKASETLAGGRAIRWSADFAVAHGLEGVRFFKAVGEDGIK